MAHHVQALRPWLAEELSTAEWRPWQLNERPSAVQPLGLSCSLDGTVRSASVLVLSHLYHKALLVMQRGGEHSLLGNLQQLVCTIPRALTYVP